MKKLFHPLLELIATAAENELAAIIQHLKEENRILRDKLPKRVQLTDEERQQLVKTGSPSAQPSRRSSRLFKIAHFRLRRHQNDLLTFLDRDGVPFENNHAER